VAYSRQSESYTLASSQIQGLYDSILTSLSPSLRSHLSSALDVFQRNLPHQKIQAPESTYEKGILLLINANPFTVFALLGPLLILLFSMSSWRPNSGRHSPLTAPTRSGPPRVTEDDYSYLAGDGSLDKDTHGSGHHRDESYGLSHSSHHGSRLDQPEDLSPDILILKHKGTTYPLHFPAFSIAESGVTVRDLRREAAKQTKSDDPRRVKLLYKGRQLRDDGLTCKEEGLKQNSELMCVVSSEVNSREDGYESSSSASSNMIANGGLDGPTIDVDGTLRDPRPSKRKNHRGGGKKKKENDSPRTSPRDSATFHANTISNGAPMRPRASSISRNPSPAPPTAAPKKPLTNSDMLDAISSAFESTLLPQVRTFISHPPPDKKEKDFEYKKLSEMVLAQVLLKLDAVETEGDGELRARRKALVKKAQDWLGEMDRGMGKK